MSEEIKSLVIVMDRNANECLYVNGHRWTSKYGSIVDAVDLSGAAGTNPVTITRQKIERVLDGDEWPETLDEVLRRPPKAEEAAPAYYSCDNPVDDNPVDRSVTVSLATSPSVLRQVATMLERVGEGKSAWLSWPTVTIEFVHRSESPVVWKC